MNARPQRSSRPRLAGLLVAGALALVLGGVQPALAQSVPGGAPPTNPTADGAPPMPTQPTVVEAETPLVMPVDSSTGVSMALSLPPAAPGEAAMQASVSIAPSTLQNLTDHNGNPVQAGSMKVAAADPGATESIPALPPASVGLSDLIQFQLFDPSGNLIERPNFNPPLVLGFTPTAEQISAAGGVENIKVMVFDSLTGDWTALPVAVIDGKVYASVTHFSYFRLTATSGQPIPAMLPTTGGTDGLPLGVLEALAAIIIVLGVTLMGGRLRRAQR